jgi:3-oxoacid CoA-transferase subunit B
VPGKMIKGMGGAMDLVAGARKVVVAMQQTDKSGQSKLLPKCTLPLTGIACVHQVVTDLGFFDIGPQGFVLREFAPGVSVEQIKKSTAGRLEIAHNCKEMTF